MEKAVIIGAGGHGKVVLDIVEQIEDISIEGFINIYSNELKYLCEYPIVGKPDNLSILKDVKFVFFAVGDNHVRAEWVDLIKTNYPHIQYPIAAHPTAIYSKHVKFGEGIILAAGSVVQPYAQVGNFCLLNTASVLEHDAVMGDFSSLAPHSCTGGSVQIGEYSAIGMNATILQNVQIGEHTIVGAGSVVTRSIDSYIVAYGTPARIIRNRTKGESYLYNIKN